MKFSGKEIADMEDPELRRFLAWQRPKGKDLFCHEGNWALEVVGVRESIDQGVNLELNRTNKKRESFCVGDNRLISLLM